MVVRAQPLSGGRSAHRIETSARSAAADAIYGYTPLPVSSVLRRRQKLLLRCVATKRRGIRAVGCAAATAKARHRLHELRGRVGLATRPAHGAGRRIGGKS